MTYLPAHNQLTVPVPCYHHLPHQNIEQFSANGHLDRQRPVNQPLPHLILGRTVVKNGPVCKMFSFGLTEPVKIMAVASRQVLHEPGVELHLVVHVVLCHDVVSNMLDQAAHGRTECLAALQDLLAGCEDDVNDVIDGNTVEELVHVDGSAKERHLTPVLDPLD